ncbi:MAG: hypothetical protein HY744_26750 [Deltaproteobacteria bacterium]|nr:hypothetical protein [Deltaproteobacteria bacterium]
MRKARLVRRCVALGAAMTWAGAGAACTDVPAEPQSEARPVAAGAAASVAGVHGDHADYEPRPRFPAGAPGGDDDRDVAVAVWIEPLDLSSIVGESDLRIGVESRGKELPEAGVEALRGAVELATWPEGQSVRAHLRVTGEQTGDVGPRRYVVVKPAARLEDRWYALRVVRLPVGFGWAVPGGYYRERDGAVAARFRPGSDPRVWGIQLCNRQGVNEIVVDFTERLARLPAGEVLAVYQRGQRLGCELHLAAAPEEKSFRQAWLDCSSLDSQQAIEVRVSAGARALSGKPVTDWSGRAGPAFEVVASRLDSWGTDCRLYRP